MFLPFGGAANFPSNFLEFGSEAGRLGYHTIGLAYKNEVPISNVNACGNEELPLPTSPPNCAINARMEIHDGRGESTVVNVDRPNSIENRLNKVLAELATNPAYAGEGWEQFREADGTPRWSQTVIAGASLGAGQAALIAQLHSVHRVALFGGWTDAKHPEELPPAPPRLWVKIAATPAEKYSSLIHFRDVFYPRTCPAYAVFGMTQPCPLTLPSELAENRQPPFGTRQLVFNLPRDPTAPEQQNGSFHPSVIRDTFIAKAADGVTASPTLVELLALHARRQRRRHAARRGRPLSARRVRRVPAGPGRRNGSGDARTHARAGGDVRRVHARHRAHLRRRPRPRT